MPWATKSAIRFVIVCDLPVPGGPWMMKCLPVRASAIADACVGSQLTIG